jgi:hypothetical protein
MKSDGNAEGKVKVFWFFSSEKNAFFLLLSAALITFRAAAAPMPKDPAALDIADVFSHTCLHNGAQPGRVAAWAVQQKLPELGPTDARKDLVADGPDARAWLIRGPATNMLLAVRGSSGSCAVYGEHADAADFGRVYDMYLSFLAPPGTKMERQPDRVSQGTFGTVLKRSATIYAKHGKRTEFLMSVNEGKAGPYQMELVIATH